MESLTRKETDREQSQGQFSIPTEKCSGRVDLTGHFCNVDFGLCNINISFPEETPVSCLVFILMSIHNFPLNERQSQ